MQEEQCPILDICGKKTLEYVFTCLSMFNFCESVKIRGMAGNISKAVSVAEILVTSMEGCFRIEHTQIFPVTLKDLGIPYSMVEIVVGKTQEIDSLKKKEMGYEEYLNYPVYNTFFDALLQDDRYIEVTDKNSNTLYFLNKKASKHNIHIDTKSDLSSILVRSGMMMPANWKSIASKISEYDDIIIGLDTNILHYAGITEHIIPLVSVINPKQYVHTPNWLLFVVPGAVMYELEDAANNRTDRGLMSFAGRKGFRGLQEMIDLSESSDILGVSVIISGEANPVLDTRVELEGLRKDLVKVNRNISQLSRDEHERPFDCELVYHKMSSGDTIIRDQFKNFLRQIDFHKGTYFMTADKTNKALALAEGLHPIFYKFPGYHSNPIEEFTLNANVNGSDTHITFHVPVGKLLYETAVQFGEINVRFGDKQYINLGCDAKGEHLDNWLNRRLHINKIGSDIMKDNYNGGIGLEYINELWKKLLDNFGAIED